MGDEYSGPAATSNEPFIIDIVTLFPEMFAGPFDHSMVARAAAAGIVAVRVHDLRSWATDRHRTTDDYPFGGGGGMVMKPEPLFAAVEALLGLAPITAEAPAKPPHPVVLMAPQGQPFDDALARQLAAAERIVILCGHYEGVDDRVRQHLATHEVSIGDFVVTGGELPAMLVADAVARLRPGVLGLETGAATESFADGWLEHPHYTRPASFRGWRAPDVLLSGHHAEVDRWRRQAALRRTLERRPWAVDPSSLTADDRTWLEGETAAGPQPPPEGGSPSPRP
jgi:tRNA (guanine37-N1)-methyltransferase